MKCQKNPKNSDQCINKIQDFFSQYVLKIERFRHFPENRSVYSSIFVFTGKSAKRSNLEKSNRGKKYCILKIHSPAFFKFFLGIFHSPFKSIQMAVSQKIKNLNL